MLGMDTLRCMGGQGQSHTRQQAHHNVHGIEQRREGHAGRALHHLPAGLHAGGAHGQQHLNLVAACSKRLQVGSRLPVNQVLLGMAAFQPGHRLWVWGRQLAGRIMPLAAVLSKAGASETHHAQSHT